MRRIALATFAVQLFLAAPGEAADPPSTPSLPPIVLTVIPPEAGKGGGPWKLRVANNGDVPVRIAADPRLLSLELTPKEGKPLRCALPEDTRPTNDEGRELVVPGKRSWTVAIDPAYYCFGAKERAALVPGTQIVARFGWAPPKKAKGEAPPFAAVPVGAAVGKLAPQKELESAPFTLDEAPGTPPATEPTKPEPEIPPPVAISLPEAVDVARGGDVAVTVTLANTSDRPVTTLFRPSTLGFRVSGPSGTVRCGAPQVNVASPIRELFTTMPAKGKTQLTLMLAAVCPPDTFDEPGIYRIVPRLDTSGASGRALGLKTFDGEVEGKTPMLLRVRNPLHETTTARPKLDV